MPDIDRVLEAADAETLRRMVRVLAEKVAEKAYADVSWVLEHAYREARKTVDSQ